MGQAIHFTQFRKIEMEIIFFNQLSSVQKYHLKKNLLKKNGAIAIGEEENYMKNISPPKYRGYYHRRGGKPTPYKWIIQVSYQSHNPATNLIIP